MSLYEYHTLFVNLLVTIQQQYKYGFSPFSVDLKGTLILDSFRGLNVDHVNDDDVLLNLVEVRSMN
jgi:hypothetical protein